MTATLPARVPAGLPGGGRFAPKACAGAYAALDALGVAVDLTCDVDGSPLPAGWTRDPHNPNRIHIAPLVPPCPHGFISPWGIASCRGCHPAAGTPAGAAVGGDPDTCRGHKVDGSPCTRRTSRRDRRGRPACHDHGGHPTTAV